jgi:molybdopterin-guanine dinucleotide biosynthesis protein A/endonuclease/exonuclease/phosphatase family metal-dependent hydrolase
MSLRLVTSNLLHGRSLIDGLVDTERMVSALAKLAPTVLALQEVDRFQTRSGTVDQVAAIAQRIPGASWRFVPAIVGVPGADWRPAVDATSGPDSPTGHDLAAGDATTPSYGTGLITTLPVQSWHVIRVKPFRFRAPVFIPGMGKGAKSWMMIDDEPRVCIAAVVTYTDGRGADFTMTVAATHASFVPGWNIPQLRQITGALSKLPAPQILLGDLNLPAPLPAKAVGWKPLASGLPTFPSPNPKMQLDHVLLHDPGGRLAAPGSPLSSAEAIHLSFSDHRAIVVNHLTIMPFPQPDNLELPPFTVAMLAGGASRRMGEDKALLDVDLDGEPMGARILVSSILAGATEALAVGGNAPALREQGWTFVADRWPGEGPLGGLITALERAAHPIVVVLGCDHPDVDPAEIVALVEAVAANHEVEAVVPTCEGQPHVMHSVWRTRCAPQLLSAFGLGERSPVALLRRIRWSPSAVVNLRSISDLDTQDELAERRAGVR